jgi:hypothetical protein
LDYFGLKVTNFGSKVIDFSGKVTDLFNRLSITESYKKKEKRPEYGRAPPPFFSTD